MVSKSCSRDELIIDREDPVRVYFEIPPGDLSTLIRKLEEKFTEIQFIERKFVK